ncbi:TM2 domain-containing protein [Salinispora vitiensis]|uniref:TM2 domain-containing protein n=1 Tax=Salinispora vitiensis TaxID=999544 RepID=UPI0003669DF0|nr:TM2 domain-containing protein [Salinispora vitiensis]
MTHPNPQPEQPGHQPGQPGWPGQPGYQPGQPGWPGQPGYQPGQPGWSGHPGWSDKSKLVAGLLQILLGGFGIGRFYMGDTKTGVLQIIVTLVTCGVGSLWGFVDGILILVNGGVDAYGRPLRD